MSAAGAVDALQPRAALDRAAGCACSLEREAAPQALSELAAHETDFGALAEARGLERVHRGIPSARVSGLVGLADAGGAQDDCEDWCDVAHLSIVAGGAHART